MEMIAQDKKRNGEKISQEQAVIIELVAYMKS